MYCWQQRRSSGMALLCCFFVGDRPLEERRRREEEHVSTSSHCLAAFRWHLSVKRGPRPRELTRRWVKEWVKNCFARTWLVKTLIVEFNTEDRVCMIHLESFIMGTCVWIYRCGGFGVFFIFKRICCKCVLNRNCSRFYSIFLSAI